MPRLCERRLLLRSQAVVNGVAIAWRVPVELRCHSAEFLMQLFWSIDQWKRTDFTCLHPGNSRKDLDDRVLNRLPCYSRNI